jgi:crotonobetainyl-CoA:carnitine CoA-transferase CaiB-like acyl-CoA transferase
MAQISAPPSAAHAALAQLWSLGGGRPDALQHVQLIGDDPALPSSFAIGTLAQASIAACGLAAAELWRQRSGREQSVSVDMRHAAAEFRSERYMRTDAPSADLWDKLAGLYPVKGGDWVRLHTNFAHHRDGILQLLGAEATRDSIAAKLAAWTGVDFETAAADANLCVTLFRSPEAWAVHAQGQAVAALPVLEIIKIGDAPPRPLPSVGARPLAGLRVLDLTRIIAGPVAGRTLAAHGADVLYVSSPHLPTIPSLVIDTGRGKRPAHLDLDQAADRHRLLALARSADVFLQGYRPGGLAARGFGPDAVAAAAPGIVCVSLSAYGHTGPWSMRRGFDSLTQNANGLNFAEAEALAAGGPVTRPKELPAQALDHAAGYLLAFGAMRALARRADEGGSWLVRTSLAQVGEWLKRLPRSPNGHGAPDPTFDTVQEFIETTPSGFGRLQAIRHAAQLSETRAYYAHAAQPLGNSPAEWA